LEIVTVNHQTTKYYRTESNLLMIKKRKDGTKKLINILSVFIYAILYFAVIYFSYDNDFEFDYGIRGYLLLIIIYIFVVSSLLNMFDAFNLGNKRIVDIFISCVFSLFFGITFEYFELGLIEGHLVSLVPHFKLLFIQLIFAFIYAYYGSRAIRFNFLPENTLLIYGDSSYKILKNKLKKYQNYEFSIEKCISEKRIDFNYIGNTVKDYDCVITYEIDHNNKKQIVKKCYELNKTIYDVPSILDVLIKSSSVTNFIDTPLFKLYNSKYLKIGDSLKRAIDVFLSILIGLITLPIFIVTSVVIKIQDGGDVFFRQKRLTLNGKEFYLIKFRSMIMNAEPNGKAIRAKNDDNRITPFGKFIRATRIDELPQIINIIKGDLSLVGPRALRIEEYKQNERKFPEFKYRLKVKAGLTGYAQIYGKYNTSFRDKLLLDMYYIENRSLIIDAKLLMMTLVTVFKKDSTEGF